MLQGITRILRAPAPPRKEDLQAAFKVLGLSLSQKPSVSDVRLRYRELARLHHPDLSSGDDNKMKVINTAYELIQTSGVLLRPAADTVGDDASNDAGSSKEERTSGERFRPKAGAKRRRVPDDFASGDDTSWAMKSSLDWERMVRSADTLTEQELRNPANHPFSHSKFYSFEDDATIYRMIRGGATVPQVARTLGKAAIFIEKRLHNAQFKQRVQYLLRHQKKADSRQAVAKERQAGSSLQHPQDGAKLHAAPPRGPNMTIRATRRGPYDSEQHYVGNFGLAAKDRPARVGSSGRVREWEASYPEWRAPQFFENMSLEEKGRHAGIISSQQADAAPHSGTYSNYQRMQRGRR